MKKDNKITLGLDIGGTNLKAIALELPANQVLKEHEFPSGAQVSPEAVRQAIVDTVNMFKKDGLKIDALGIGVAGSVAPSGLVRNSPNFNNWENVPLKDWIKEDFKIPITVDNDANCAAYTEWKAGAGKGYTNILLLTLGTGVGGGLIINNHLLRGSTGSAGEIGHFSIHTDGVECPCGNRGCCERYCSASALEAKLPGLTTKEIFERVNEPAIKEVFDEFMNDFCIGLTSLANIFDPEIILFAGGISQGMAPYLDHIHDWLKRHAFPAVGPNVKLQLAEHGTLSGALGAALIASDQL